MRNSATWNSRPPSPRRSSTAASWRARLLDGAEHVGLARDRIGKALLGHRGRHRQARHDRFVGAAQRLIETEQQRLAEARGERRARPRGQIGDADEARGLQVRDDVGIDAQRRDRQRQHGRFGFAARDDALFAIARDAPGAADRVGNRDAGAQALLREPRDQIAGERRFAAEQMRAAGDVEQQAIRRIEADQRRVAVAPVGDGFEQAPVGLRIGVHDRQRRIHGAGVGEPHADLQAEPRRAIGQRGDALRRLDRRDDDEGSQPARTSGARSGRSRAAAATPTDTAGWKARS